MKTLILSAIIATFCLTVHSQTVTREANIAIDGDKWIKTRADITPGPSGEDIVWHYSIDSDGNSYASEISVNGNDIVNIEDGWLYRYALKGDSLLCSGYENRLSKTVYFNPTVRLSYPFTYGKGHRTHLRGLTRYGDRLYVGFRGEESVTADACGIITDGVDTIRNVLRINHKRDFIQSASLDCLVAENFALSDSASAADSLHVLEIDYEWYCPQARYPVMGYHSTHIITDNDTILRSRSAYLSLPESQRYDLGPTNTESRRTLNGNYDMDHGSPKNPDENQSDDNGVERITASLIPGTNTVDVSYDLSRTCDVTLALHEAFGRQLTSIVRLNSQPGSHSDSLTLPYKPIGVIMLIITVDGTPQLQKVL